MTSQFSQNLSQQSQSQRQVLSQIQLNSQSQGEPQAATVTETPRMASSASGSSWQNFGREPPPKAYKDMNEKDCIAHVAKSLGSIMRITVNNNFRQEIFRTMQTETSDETVEKFQMKLTENCEKAAELAAIEAAAAASKIKRRRKKKVGKDVSVQTSPLAVTNRNRGDADADSDIEIVDVVIRSNLLPGHPSVKIESQEQSHTPVTASLPIEGRSPACIDVPSQPLSLHEIMDTESPPGSPSLLSGADNVLLRTPTAAKENTPPIRVIFPHLTFNSGVERVKIEPQETHTQPRSRKRVQPPTSLSQPPSTSLPKRPTRDDYRRERDALRRKLLDLNTRKN